MSFIVFSARELCVGRVKKCTGFTDYVRRALKKLNIPGIAQPSDDTLEDYHAKYLSRLTELQRYLQVRSNVQLYIVYKYINRVPLMFFIIIGVCVINACISCQPLLA